MRLLADENFPKPIVEALRAGGHDVLWARTDCVGWKDPVLLGSSESEARIVLTLDKDFWQIAVQRRVPLKQSDVVLFRAHPAIPANFGPLARTLSRRIGHGPDTSASSPPTGFKCWLLAGVDEIPGTRAIGTNDRANCTQSHVCRIGKPLADACGSDGSCDRGTLALE